MVSPIQKLLEIIETNAQSNTQTDCGPQRVSTADPIPKPEHISRINPEFGNLRRVCAQSNEMFSNGCFLKSRNAYNIVVNVSNNSTSLATSKNHFLEDVALVIVSCVVNVFEAIIKRTVSGSTFFSTSARWVPSIFDTK